MVFPPDGLGPVTCLRRWGQFLELQRIEVGELQLFEKVRSLESPAEETTAPREYQVSTMVPISPVEEPQIELDACRGHHTVVDAVRGTIGIPSHAPSRLPAGAGQGRGVFGVRR